MTTTRRRGAAAEAEAKAGPSARRSRRRPAAASSSEARPSSSQARRSRRRRASIAAASTAAFALIAVSLAGCGRTEPVNTSPQTQTTSSPTTPSATVIAERNAVAQLQSYLGNPLAGTLTYNRIQVDGAGSMNVLTILSGPFDPTAPQASLTGEISTLGPRSTPQVPAQALELQPVPGQGAQVYTSVPAAQQTGPLLGKQWASTPVQAAWGGRPESGWWLALDEVQDLHLDGATTLDGITVDMFSEELDLSQVPDMPKQLLDSDPVKNAGTTKIDVDVYTALGSGQLMRVTYKIGLPVEIDATANPDSSEGYQVDLSEFTPPATSAAATPTPVVTATAPDAAIVAAKSGDLDLAAMLPF